jgi:hypothetical protein
MNLLRFRKQPVTVDMSPDGSVVRVMAGARTADSFHIGPNDVSAIIVHNPGCAHGVSDWEVEDLGISHNLLNTGAGAVAGRDQFAGSGGGVIPAGGSGSPFNGAPSTTSFTATGTPWTVNQLTGLVAIAAVTGVTTAPVHFRIISNTNAVATGEGWYTEDGTTLGTTPSTTNGYVIVPGAAPAKFMALTENNSAAAAANTALTAEITTGGCGRAKCTYAHTVNSATYTLQKAFSVTASFPAIHRIGIFPFATASGSTMCFEAVLNADANVVNLDTLTITDTVTVS